MESLANLVEYGSMLDDVWVEVDVYYQSHLTRAGKDGEPEFLASLSDGWTVLELLETIREWKQWA